MSNCEHGQLERTCLLCEMRDENLTLKREGLEALQEWAEAEARLEAELTTLRAENERLREDAERLNNLQDMFIKGEEFLICFCKGDDADQDCESEEHPHFEAFDWTMKDGPVFAKTIRDVIDNARAARQEEG